MRVKKRDQSFEAISFDKVLRRIHTLSTDLSGVDADEIAQKVCARIYDGVSTSELDELAAQMCATLVTVHPDYGTLAARIIISNHHKNTSPSFSETMSMLYNATDVHGKNNHLISNELWAIVQAHKEKLNSYIDYQRDYSLDYFGFKTLERAYLNKVHGKVVERPQHLWMRVALGIHGWDLKEALETYDLMSQRFFTHATPTLFNAGTPLGQLASCFLIGTHDSVSGMYKTIGDCGMISKYAGGIGVHVSNIRARGSHIRGTNGISSGIIPMLRVYNATARHINQAGKRLGSIAIYLEPWHADIEAFLDLRKNHGAEEERCRDLFTSMWIPDLFMKRVQANGDWSLMCPDECPGLADVVGEEFEKLYQKYEEEGRYRKKVKAQTIWMSIIKSQIETGTPYLCYKDAANIKSNQKNIGVIKSSNLCVAPETRILTKKGYKVIRDVVNQDVEVWNGVEWSKTKVVKTNEDAELIRVTFSDGNVLECTPYHKFFVQVGYNKKKIVKKEARELNVNDKLIKWSPPAAVENDNQEEFKYPYTHGFFCADGTYYTNYRGDTKLPKVYFYGDKKTLIDKVEVRTSSFEEDASGKISATLPQDLADKFTVPFNARLKDKLEWLAGMLDGDGTIHYNPDRPEQLSLAIGSIHIDFLRNIMHMLQTIGVSSSINKMRDACTRMMPNGKGGEAEYQCKECFRLCIPALSVSKLIEMGLKTYRLNLDGHVDVVQDNRHYVCVTSVEWTGRRDATYCFNEPKREMGVFNGVLTGNCSEIIEYSDENEYATCNLASIALPAFVKTREDGTKYFDFEQLHRISQTVTRNINKVIDRTFYPVPETERSNKRHRPIGIGIQGLADAYALMRFAFDSPEAAKLNREIFETIYHGAMTASMLISKRREELREELGSSGVTDERKAVILKHLNMTPEEEALESFKGAYVTFEGSPLHKGQFQFDLWDVQPEGKWDWNTLRKDVMRHGVRNSLLLAPMPTASTSQILGNTECFEPITSNIFQRQTLAGEFTIINKYLIRDLIELGLWSVDMKNRILAGGGSIQEISEIPADIRALYKTAWELKQKVLIDQAAERGIYVCQSQSLNLFVEDPDINRISNMHMYAWSRGLKTGIYYLRTRPKAKMSAFTLDPSLSAATSTAKQTKGDQEEPVMVCRRDDPTCAMCSA